ncbi:hypothetical protein S245_062855, partial [Arachis hypogaea]
DEEASSTAPCHHIIRCAPHPAEENVVVSEGVAVFLVHHHRREPLPSGILWGVSGALVKAKFKNGGSGAELWAGLFKWMPFGTLIANVSAACVMAALSTVKEA